MNRLRLEHEVGKGAYGIVYLGHWREAQGSRERKVAVKCIKRDFSSKGVPHNACREIGMLKELHHDNVVELLEVVVNVKDMELNVVLDWADYDLNLVWYTHYRMHHPPLRMALEMIRGIMFQLVCGAEYMHAQWVMHRDIKCVAAPIRPANVLLTQDGRVKLADFGLARIFQAPTRPLADDRVVVTHWYRAPELLLGARHYTHAIDVWALGTVFAELILGEYMFPGKDTKEAFNRHMITKIFDRIGKPDATVWPTLVDMPFWEAASAITHAEGADERASSSGAPLEPYARREPAIKQHVTALLRERSAAGTANVLSRHMSELLMRMLHYDPLARITCRQAREHAAFVGSEDKLLGNVFALGPPVDSKTWAAARAQMEHERKQREAREEERREEERRAHQQQQQQQQQQQHEAHRSKRGDDEGGGVGKRLRESGASEDSAKRSRDGGDAT